MQDQQLIFFQAIVVLVDQFAEHGDFDLRRTIVEHQDHPFAPLTHHGAGGGDNPRHPLQVSQGFEPRKRLGDDLAHFIAPGIEQVAAEVIAECDFFLGEQRA